MVVCRYLFCLQSSITVYTNIYIDNYIYICTIIHLWCIYYSQSIRMSHVFVYINHGTKTRNKIWKYFVVPPSCNSFNRKIRSSWIIRKRAWRF